MTTRELKPVKDVRNTIVAECTALGIVAHSIAWRVSRTGAFRNFEVLSGERIISGSTLRSLLRALRRTLSSATAK